MLATSSTFALSNFNAIYASKSSVGDNKPILELGLGEGKQYNNKQNPWIVIKKLWVDLLNNMKLWVLLDK